MQLSIAVMTHPSRQQSADRLVQAHPDLPMQIVTDPNPDGPPAALRTARRAWAALPETATHHLVLQDDVRGTAELGWHVRSAVTAMPNTPLCFFTEWGSKTAQLSRLAALAGCHWARIPDHLHTSQAILLPAAIVADFLAHVETPGVAADDTVADADVLFGFLRDRGLEPLVAVPNLVEHIEVPSLLGNSLLRGPRHSPCFDPALPVRPWSSRIFADPPVLPYFSTREARSLCELRTDGTGHKSQQTVDWLRGQGMPLPALIESFRDALHDLPAVAWIQSAVAETLVFEIWLTAVASGIAIRESHNLHSTALDSAMGDPVAVRYWESFVPGALRKILPLSMSRHLSEELKPLLRAAIRDEPLGARSSHSVGSAG